MRRWIQLASIFETECDGWMNDFSTFYSEVVRQCVRALGRDGVRREMAEERRV